MSDPDPWLGMAPASYKADGEIEIVFPVRSVGEDGGLRIAKRTRPFQRGSKLDDTGAESDTFQIEAVFHNDIGEPDLGEETKLWPTRLELLIAHFKTGKTATLHLPWKRNLRVKAEKWQRRAVADELRGGEFLSVTFIEDNEDTLDREAFERVAVKSNADRFAINASFTAESTGLWDGSIEDVTQLASELVGYMNAPGEYADQVLHAARRVRRACGNVLEALESKVPGGDGPDAAGLRQTMLDLLDLAAAAGAEAQANLPKTRTVRFDRPRDLFSIASEFGQNPRELIAVNSQLEDPAYIEAGEAVLVFVG